MPKPSMICQRDFLCSTTWTMIPADRIATTAPMIMSPARFMSNFVHELAFFDVEFLLRNDFGVQKVLKFPEHIDWRFSSNAGLSSRTHCLLNKLRHHETQSQAGTNSHSLRGASVGIVCSGFHGHRQLVLHELIHTSNGRHPGPRINHFLH